MVNSADYPRSVQEILNRVFDATNNRLAVNIGGANQTFNDDILLRLGTDGDQVFVNRSTTLAANTALTNVLVGTPVSQAIAANTLIISNVTGSGDIAIYGNLGGNSQQYIFIDTSAAQIFFDQANVFIRDGQSLIIGNDTLLTAGQVDVISQILGTTTSDSSLMLQAASVTDTVRPGIHFVKDAGAALGSGGLVANGEDIGEIVWYGGDNNDLSNEMARIQVQADAATGLGDTPGRIMFSTTADGASLTTERLRINNTGDVILNNVAAVGAAAADQVKLHATDIAAGDARLAVQSETGGAIYIGNNAIRISGINVLGAQGASIADASGGANADAEARTALNALLARLRTHGLIAT